MASNQLSTQTQSTLPEASAAVAEAVPDGGDQPFVTFPCECSAIIPIYTQLQPGQAAVVECNNCFTSYTVFNPSLIISKTKDLPADLQEVWKRLSE